MGMQHENEYNDKLRLSKSQSFADVRLQEYIIRKRGTSEFEKKFNHQMDEIKTRLSQNKLTDVDEIDCNEEDVDYQEEEKNNVKNEEGNETKTLTEDLNDNVSKSEDRISSDEATDTSKIEQAVGLIEVNHNKPNEENQCIKDLLSMQLEKDTSENQEKKKTHSPQKKKKKKKKKKENETKKKEPANKLKTKTSSKLKRSFIARTSKNRLQFSVLGSILSPKKNNHSESTNAENTNESKIKSVLTTAKIKSLNDFEDDRLNIPSNPIIEPNNDESSDDGFDDSF